MGEINVMGPLVLGAALVLLGVLAMWAGAVGSRSRRRGLVVLGMINTQYITETGHDSYGNPFVERRLWSGWTNDGRRLWAQEWIGGSFKRRII